MSSNISNSSFLSEKTLNRSFYLYGLYTIKGFLGALLNLIFFAAIWSVPSLREKKEYIIISAIALMDTIKGLRYLTAGIGRIRLILKGQANILMTSFDCLLAPWNVCWILTGHMYGMTLAVVSLDRLLLIWDPLRYLGLGRSYAYGILAVTHLPYLAMITRLIVSLVVNELAKNKPSICFMEWVYKAIPGYLYVVNTQNMAFSMISVLMYVAILYKYRKNQTQILPTLVASDVKKEVKKQRNLTKTLGFSCLFTLVFIIFPVFVKNVLASMDSSNEFMAVFVPD